MGPLSATFQGGPTPKVSLLQPSTLQVDRHFTVLHAHDEQEINMLWTIVAVLLVLWLLGFSLGVGGGLVHLVLVVAVVVVVINLLSGRRRLT